MNDERPCGLLAKSGERKRERVCVCVCEREREREKSMNELII